MRGYVVGARRASPSGAAVSIRRETDVFVVATSHAHPAGSAVRRGRRRDVARVPRLVARKAERLLEVHLCARVALAVRHRDARPRGAVAVEEEVPVEANGSEDFDGKVG